MRNAIGRKILLSLALFLGISTLQTVPVYAEPTVQNTTLTGPLQDLSVNDAPLSPVLSDDVTEYTVVLPEDTTTIEISATPTNAEAEVSGTGSFTIEDTSDTYRVRVQDGGETTTYRISVTLSNTPVLTTVYEESSLGFTVNIDTTTVPEGFSEGRAVYEGSEVRVWQMDALNFQIVNLQDGNGTAGWYAYQDGAVTGPFKAMVFNRHRYFYTGVASDMQSQDGCTFTSIEVQGETLDGWTFNDADYASYYMLYLTDETGTSNYYVYDTQNKTLVDRRVFESEVGRSRQGIPMPLLVAIGIIVVMAAIFAVVIVSANRKRGLKETAKTIGNHVNPAKRKNKKKTRVPDHVELVRTSKVKIYAQPTDQPQTAKQEVEKVRKAAHQKQVAQLEEKKLARTQALEAEKLTRSAQAKKKTAETAKKSRSETSAEPVVKSQTTKKVRTDPTVEPAAKSQTAKKPVKKTTDAKKSVKKKNTETTSAKERFKRKETPIPVPKDPASLSSEPVKQPEKPVSEPAYQEDPMTEIQRYIDQLFYANHDQNQTK